MHRTCKNTSVNLTGTFWMIRSEKLCKGNLSTSLLEELTCSDAARSSSSDIGNSDCENRAKREIGNQVVWKRHGGSWVSHVPMQKIDMKKRQVRRLLVPVSSVPPAPPAKLEVLHLFRWFTHTHTPKKNSPTITPPSLLYFLFPSCFPMLSLSLEKLVTWGVIRSCN